MQKKIGVERKENDVYPKDYINIAAFLMDFKDACNKCEAYEESTTG